MAGAAAKATPHAFTIGQKIASCEPNENFIEKRLRPVNPNAWTMSEISKTFAALNFHSETQNVQSLKRCRTRAITCTTKKRLSHLVRCKQSKSTRARGVLVSLALILSAAFGNPRQPVALSRASRSRERQLKKLSGAWRSRENHTLGSLALSR